MKPNFPSADPILSPTGTNRYSTSCGMLSCLGFMRFQPFIGH